MPYFLYELLEGEATRYIGMALDPNSRLQGHLRDAEKGVETHCCNWIRKLARKGQLPRMLIMAEAQTKKQACQYERALIESYRGMGHDLTNMTEGGEGGVSSEEIRKKIGAKALGRVHSEESRKKISEGLRRNYENNPAARAARGKATRGKHRSEETRRKIGESNKGRVCTDQMKEAIRRSRLGKPLSPEHRERIALSNTGGKRTEEQKVRMSAAQRLHWQKLREIKG